MWLQLTGFFFGSPLWAHSAAQKQTSGSVHVILYGACMHFNVNSNVYHLRPAYCCYFCHQSPASNQTNDMGEINLCLDLGDLTSICCTTLCFLGAVNFDKAICQKEYPNCHIELVLEVIQVTLAYFIPMLAVIICYSLIIIQLCAKSLQKNKPIKIFSVVVLFILTEIPYAFFRLINIIDWSFKLNSSFDYTITLTKTLAYFYGCLKPSISSWE